MPSSITLQIFATTSRIDHGGLIWQSTNDVTNMLITPVYYTHTWHDIINDLLRSSTYVGNWHWLAGCLFPTERTGAGKYIPCARCCWDASSLTNRAQLNEWVTRWYICFWLLSRIQRNRNDFQSWWWFNTMLPINIAMRGSSPCRSPTDVVSALLDG